MSIEIASVLIVVGTACVILLAAAGSIAATIMLVRVIRKNLEPGDRAAQPDRNVSAGIPKAGQAVSASLKAHSDFVKRVDCSQCGAPKTMPSKTAYLYCDYCSSLMDYDFRIANANTNAGLTNTVYHRLLALEQPGFDIAKANQDWAKLREIYTRIYDRWMRECPMAVSPRAEHDEEFRAKMLTYLVESAMTKDMDPETAAMDAELQRLGASLGRVPMPGGAWRFSGPFWEYAQTFKKQMEVVYKKMADNGVLALDPDNAPPGVPLRMELSTVAQGFLPHLSAEDGQKLLKLYGLSGEYEEVKPLDTDTRQCGNCGSQIVIVPEAREVICDTCYHPIDVQSQPLPCRKCGNRLSFPVDADRIACPYCGTENRRV